MTDREKLFIGIIIGNFVADNIAFELKVLAHHPPLELRFFGFPCGFEVWVRYQGVGSQKNFR